MLGEITRAKSKGFANFRIVKGRAKSHGYWVSCSRPGAVCVHRMLAATCEERVPLVLWCPVELSLGFRQAFMPSAALKPCQSLQVLPLR